ncbi:uncharacterized protein LOC111709266, partial [Eurytemora carolleeae]|uniref:uncharacterized protein LOC111709266 n=1 Tax=Eurytemora carolleeae TaxID=1294199 RepID=UPI000C758F86
MIDNARFNTTSWVPTRLLLPLTWILSLILVLPYLKFISFLSLDSLGLAFKGGQMCAVNMENNVAPYMRGMFVVLFLVPVVLSLGLMWTVWDNLTHIQTELSGVGLQDIQDNEGSLSLRSEFSMRTGNRSQELLQSLDIHKEKRAQKFLVLILSSHFLCVLPINVLKLVRYSVVETYENESAYDLAYGILVFITFLPTLILPFFYSRWILIGSLWSELLKLGAGFTTPPQQNVFLEQD